MAEMGRPTHRGRRHSLGSLGMFKKNVEPNTGTHDLCFLIVGVRRPVFSTIEDSDPNSEEASVKLFYHGERETTENIDTDKRCCRCCHKPDLWKWGSVGEFGREKLRYAVSRA